MRNAPLWKSASDLRGGIELGVATILKLGDTMRSAEARADLRGRHIIVRVTNERARIDLNTAQADVLRGLFRSAGLDNTEAAALAANVVAWRGGGAEDKPAGPPDDHHQFAAPRSVSFDTPIGAAPRQAGPKMPSLHLFVHPVQLVSVPGLSRNLVKRLFPLLTVANGASEINPFIAGPEVLSALPDATSGSVAAFLGARDGNVSRETAIQLLGVDKKLLSEDAASGWRLQITSTSRSGRRHSSEAIVTDINSDGDQPYNVVYVLDDIDQVQR